MHLNILHNVDSDYNLASPFTYFSFPFIIFYPQYTSTNNESILETGEVMSKLITITDLENKTLRNNALFVSCGSERGSQENSVKQMLYLNISWQTEVDFWKGFLFKCIQSQQCGDGSLIILSFLILVYSCVLEPTCVSL